MRVDSASMRARAVDGSVAPSSASSANPRIVVSGVRSSWLASATNCRIRPSDSRACFSDSAWAAKASSMRVTMTLNEPASWSTSVLVAVSGTRRLRSPAAISCATSDMSESGLRLRRTTT